MDVAELMSWTGNWYLHEDVLGTSSSMHILSSYWIVLLWIMMQSIIVWLTRVVISPIELIEDIQWVLSGVYDSESILSVEDSHWTSVSTHF